MRKGKLLLCPEIIRIPILSLHGHRHTAGNGHTRASTGELILWAAKCKGMKVRKCEGAKEM